MGRRLNHQACPRENCDDWMSGGASRTFVAVCRPEGTEGSVPVTHGRWAIGFDPSVPSGRQCGAFDKMSWETEPLVTRAGWKGAL